MKTIAVGEFKSKCLSLLEGVRSKKNHLIITKRGEPIAEVIPFKKEKKKGRNPRLGTIIYQGDIVSPTGVKWEADL